jgi:hypothetical protein
MGKTMGVQAAAALMGRKGGKARARALSPERRKEIAIMGGLAAQREFAARLKASDILCRAVKKGRVRRPETCSQCQTVGKTEGHHEDYDKPLSVIWLCRKCHKQRHRRAHMTPAARLSHKKRVARAAARERADRKVEACAFASLPRSYTSLVPKRSPGKETA